ncbi:MAG: HD domain-containing protein, partial [Clostridia bacterium]|nr:HD domain-containing protein [Clostridia bacterium]
MITYNDIKHNENIRTYIKKADEALGVLGYTEHSFAHVAKVAETAGQILSTLGYSEREVELVKIAGFLHDIGNLVNRVEHSQSGAVSGLADVPQFQQLFLLFKNPLLGMLAGAVLTAVIQSSSASVGIL